jgi:hypothetical protein
MATVTRTDCKTGWQVWHKGRLYLTVRRVEAARAIAAELNARDYSAKTDTDGGAAEPFGRCQ